MLVNNRLGKGYDVKVCEQCVNPPKDPAQRWESCMTLNGNWGWHAGDAIIITSTLQSHAMNHNLLGPWANPPRCSPPQTPLFAFFNRQNANFIFHDGDDKVEIWCLSAVRTPALS